MRKFGLKFRIVLILMIILALAMFLQSIIVLYIGLRASIKEDIVWAKQLLKISSIQFYSENKASLVVANDSPFFNIYRDTFPCVFIERDGKIALLSSACHFQKELIEKSRKAKTTRNPVISFADEGWRGHYLGGKRVLLSIPLVDASGEVQGSINAEYSLSQVYQRFQKESLLALCYLLANLIILGTIGVLRISRIFFRPLEKLMLITENYRSDEQSLLTFSDDGSPFRKLSMSLNTLIDRIRRDNRQLRKTVIELEAANNALKEKNELVIRSEKLASAGRLSAGLAHEIGNPLSIIQGYLELLGREDLSIEEKRKFSGNAQKELDRIRALIRQLLDFSRPLQNSNELVAVNDFILEVVSFVSVEKSFADCRITTDLKAEKDTLLIDRNALRQVFVNVLFNAFDATSEKRGIREVCIASYNELRDGHLYMGVKIQDNGTGIVPENIAHVFDPFYTTKEAGRGTGLGLFVCHTIIDRMGGGIAITNRIPEGVEVRLLLPLADHT